MFGGGVLGGGGLFTRATFCDGGTGGVADGRWTGQSPAATVRGRRCLEGRSTVFCRGESTTTTVADRLAAVSGLAVAKRVLNVVNGARPRQA